MRYRLIVALTAATVSSAPNAYSDSLTAAGGTAIYPVMSKWAIQYGTESGHSVVYQPVGSGIGIKEIESKAVLFANTDMPLKPKDLAANKLVQFPIVILSITPIVHLAGIKPGEISLDGVTLADIYLGKIREWDDPALKSINPNVELPHQPITTVHRSDASGTTFNFTDYLSKVSPEWKSKVGEGTLVEWPNGVEGKGNPGVAHYVQLLDGAIGYVEYAYVLENHLTSTNMINRSGKQVAPNMEAFFAAASNFDFTAVQDLDLSLTDQPGDKSWPITAAAFILLRKDTPAEKNNSALKFLEWCLKQGREQATALDYVPLPPSFIEQIEAHWSKELSEAWKVTASP
jgi:phosphate transport system substrate-binding protein